MLLANLSGRSKFAQAPEDVLLIAGRAIDRCARVQNQANEILSAIVCFAATRQMQSAHPVIRRPSSWESRRATKSLPTSKRSPATFFFGLIDS